jgi:hypothetical protein
VERRAATALTARSANPDLVPDGEARSQRERRRRGRPYARKASGKRGTHHSAMNTQALGESATARYTNGRKHSTIRGMTRSQLTTNRRPGCFSTASTNAPAGYSFPSDDLRQLVRVRTNGGLKKPCRHAGLRVSVAPSRSVRRVAPWCRRRSVREP